MTPLTVNRTRSKNSLLGQKEKKKRSSNLNLASLFLISSILFYLDHPLSPLHQIHTLLEKR